MSILKQFGTKAKYFRLKRKLSQEKLSELAKMHRTYIGQVEAGRRNISLKNVEKLAKALGVKIRDLF